MKRWLIALATVTVALIGIYGTAYVINLPNTPEPTQTVQTQEKPKPPTVDELLRLVNDERAKVGVARLTLDERLNASAQRKADEMVAENRFEHTNNAGVHGYAYAQEVAPECIYISENYTGAFSSKDAMSRWLDSTPHRLAIQDSRYDITGIAIQRAPDWYIVVEHFCDLP